MTMRLLANQFFKRTTTHAVRRAPRRHLLLDRLENRLMFAAFTDSSPALTLALATNEAVDITANANTYTLNLSSGTWGGTNNANVSGSSSATLTVQKSAFNKV